ncbi:hypothetical protein [Halalkalibacter krulwichiae]|uniref:Uncharacterized protein n=1 Tax=Halalkalibacter krulwichiae TaxID=199441 RepID=A0A1X9MG39_9BACI|nr:hypothetical protein [Halalkalibacter krulwichiae]ARK32419.1 hypothetical protein BkAM31D_22565 [Halalkalibacter krulwichiae]
MGKEQTLMYKEISTIREELSDLQVQYWSLYSDLSTWQFWLMFLLFFMIPLVSIYFFIDRKHIFQIGFFGFNIHMWLQYIDTWALKEGLWGYPYELLPFIPGNHSLETALIPVLFMYVYQFHMRNTKKFYLYSIGLCVFLGGIFKPILSLHHLFEFHKQTAFYHIILVYLVVFVFSVVITKLFLFLQTRPSPIHPVEEKG